MADDLRIAEQRPAREGDDTAQTTTPGRMPDGGADGAATARAAGRGAIAIAIAKLYFMVTGLAQQIALGNILVGGAYGALSTAMGIASITYNPLIQTGIQGVSRPVAPAPEAERPAVIRSALRVHFALGSLVAIAFLFSAPWIADATGAHYLTAVFRLFAVVLAAYAFYGPLIGILNGCQRFVAQAGLDITAATLRTLAMVGAAWWFSKNHAEGERGAAIGFGVSALTMFVIAALLTGFGRAGQSRLSAREQLRFIGPLLLGQFILNLLFQADLQLLGAFARDAALAVGERPQKADLLVGAYRATQLFGFLPYQLLIAVSFVLFPLLSKAYEAKDRAATAEYVRTGVRLAVVLAGLAVSIASGLAPALLRLVFPSQPFDRLAGPAMRLLSVGLGFFALFGILVTVLNSLRREKEAMALTAGAFAIIVGLCVLFVRGQPFHENLLLKTAAATTTGHVIATLSAAVLVKRTAGGVVSPLSALRVAIAVLICVIAARQLPLGGKVMTLVYVIAIACTYLGLLAAMREIGRADLAALRAVVSGKRRA